MPVVVFGADARTRLPKVDPVAAAMLRISCLEQERQRRMRSTAVLVDIGLPASSRYRAALSVAHAFQDGRRGVRYTQCHVIPDGQWWWQDQPIVASIIGNFDESYGDNADDWALLLIDVAGSKAGPGLKPEIIDQETWKALQVKARPARLYAHNPGRWRYEHADGCMLRAPGPNQLLYGQSVLTTDCDAIPGASGGAVVVEDADRTPRLIGIYRGPVFAKGLYQERPPNHVEQFDPGKVVNAVVPLRAEWLQELRKMAEVIERTSDTPALPARSY